ncbi:MULTISPECIES: hypothetical protein [Bacillus]|nr:hypothetical protein [Bacillus licheniformis]
MKTPFFNLIICAFLLSMFTYVIPAYASLGDSADVFHSDANPGKSSVVISTDNTIDNPVKLSGYLGNYYIGYAHKSADGTWQFHVDGYGSKQGVYYSVKNGQTLRIYHSEGNEQGAFDVSVKTEYSVNKAPNKKITASERKIKQTSESDVKKIKKEISENHAKDKEKLDSSAIRDKENKADDEKESDDKKAIRNQQDQDVTGTQEEKNEKAEQANDKTNQISSDAQKQSNSTNAGINNIIIIAFLFILLIITTVILLLKRRNQNK